MGKLPTVAILGQPGGYGELAKALKRAGAQAIVTRDHGELFDADGLIIPGHASSAEVYNTVRALDAERVVGRRIAGGRPVLAAGAAFGTLFTTINTDELGDSELPGLGEWPGTTRTLAAAGAPIGVQALEASPESALLHQLPGDLRYKSHDGVLDWEV